MGKAASRMDTKSAERRRHIGEDLLPPNAYLLTGKLAGRTMCRLNEGSTRT